MRQWSSLTDAATSLDNDFSRSHVSRVGVSLGCCPPVIRWWECLRSRDGSKGIVLVGTSRTQVDCQWATRLAVDDRKLLSVLAFQPRGFGRRTSVSQSCGQFEGCLTESLQTITATLFASADNDSAGTGQQDVRIRWKCLCPFSEEIFQAVSRSCLNEIVVWKCAHCAAKVSVEPSVNTRHLEPEIHEQIYVTKG